MFTKLNSQLNRLYDRIYCEKHLAVLEKSVTVLACVGFLTHLLLIYFARELESGGSSLLPDLDRNYLHAVYTPFSFILFYEVLLMVLALPKSLTSSIGKQYEIISLIVIRGVFKDIGEFKDFQHWTEQTDAAIAVLLDMGAAAMMFLLVTIFYHIRRRETASAVDRSIKTFISLKKAVAFLLSIFLIGLAAYSLISWTSAAVRSFFDPDHASGDLDLIFFPQFYGVMIFADVFLLLASFSFFDRFEFVFRNAGFVISTVLLRFSLTSPKPLDIVVSLIAMMFGIVVLAIFNYFAFVTRGRRQEKEIIRSGKTEAS